VELHKHSKQAVIVAVDEQSRKKKRDEKKLEEDVRADRHHKHIRGLEGQPESTVHAPRDLIPTPDLPFPCPQPRTAKLN